MDQPFSLTSEVREGVLIITTSGYVNNEGGGAIAAVFGRHFASGVKHVVINLARSKVVNSIGMSFLIEIIEQLQEVGGELFFTNLDPPVEKMLTIMGLFKFAGNAPTVEDALQSLAGKS